MSKILFTEDIEQKLGMRHVLQACCKQACNTDFVWNYDSL